MTSRHHTVLATLLVLGGLYVMRLASVEIQPFPEGLYALRGLSIQHTMQWLDQAAIAPGGMYSAMMPPLPAWMVAIGIDIVGPTPLAVRWFSVVCAMLTMFLTYTLARRVLSFEGAVMSMVIVGTSIPMIISGRQATEHVPFVAAALAMMWSAITLRDVHDRIGRLVRVFVMIVATSAGALTAPVATLILVIGTALVLRSSAQRAWMIAGMASGLALGSLWWIAMGMRYGEQVLLAWSLPQPTLGEESGGVLSALSFLVVAHPMLIVALMWVVIALRDRAQSVLRDRPEIAVIGLMFVFAVFETALSQHRYMSQAVVIVPPAAILSVLALEHVRRDARTKMLLATYVLITLAVVWYGVEHLLHDRLNVQTLLLGAAIFMVALVVLLQQVRHRSRQQAAAVRLYQPVVYGAVTIAALIALIAVVRPSPVTIEGGRPIARRMLDDSLFHKSFAYVFHNRSETDAVNAQLEWYTQGWMSGTKPGFTHMAIALPADASDEATLAIARLLPWVVYYHPQNRTSLVEDVQRSLETTHVVTYTSRHYTLYKAR